VLPSEARDLKQLREENAQLKRLMADLSLDKVMLQDVAPSSDAPRGPQYFSSWGPALKGHMQPASILVPKGRLRSG
jgi:hypothetical protein